MVFRLGRVVTQPMENWVRSFVEIDSQPINRIFRRPDPTPDIPEATISWGASSQFIFPPQTDNNGRGGVTVTWPNYDYGEDEEDDEIEEMRTWRETSRITSPKRIENPSDAAQYVIVERIDQMVMVDSLDGQSVTLIFNNPP